MKKKDKSEVLSVSLPGSLAKSASRAAKKAGVSRSKLLQQALEKYLWLEEFNELQTYGYQQAMKLGLGPDDVQRLIDEVRAEDAQNDSLRS